MRLDDRPVIDQLTEPMPGEDLRAAIRDLLDSPPWRDDADLDWLEYELRRLIR